MSTNIQLHGLTPYPLSNPNRDVDGRNKRALIGTAPRLRISSQSLKRAWRQSGFFWDDLSENLGRRTKRIGEWLYQELVKDLPKEGKKASKDKAQESAHDTACLVAGSFSKMKKAIKLKKDGSASTKTKGLGENGEGEGGEERDVSDEADVAGQLTTTLVFLSPDEQKAVLEIARKINGGDFKFKAKNLDSRQKEIRKAVLSRSDGAVDVALFGRMIAGAPEYNREAALQVGHAFTTHVAEADDDYFTAVDDWSPDWKSGAAHVGDDAALGAGVFYLNANLNVTMLLGNLEGDKELATKAAAALVEAFAKASPSGKRASFNHNPRAQFLLAELVEGNPRDLSNAFFEPVRRNFLADSVKALLEHRDSLDEAYDEQHAKNCAMMDIQQRQGSFGEVKEFVRKAVENA